VGLGFAVGLDLGFAGGGGFGFAVDFGLNGGGFRLKRWWVWVCNGFGSAVAGVKYGGKVEKKKKKKKLIVL
jgi:hypothetical protein